MVYSLLHKASSFFPGKNNFNLLKIEDNPVASLDKFKEWLTKLPIQTLTEELKETIMEKLQNAVETNKEHPKCLACNDKLNTCLMCKAISG